jgi:hypothetical protein
MNNFNFIQIQEEIEEKKPTGDLDEVFQKYCGQVAFFPRQLKKA